MVRQWIWTEKLHWLKTSSISNFRQIQKIIHHCSSLSTIIFNVIGTITFITTISSTAYSLSIKISTPCQFCLICTTQHQSWLRLQNLTQWWKILQVKAASPWLIKTAAAGTPSLKNIRVAQNLQTKVWKTATCKAKRLVWVHPKENIIKKRLRPSEERLRFRHT